MESWKNENCVSNFGKLDFFFENGVYGIDDDYPVLKFKFHSTQVCLL